jgi:hypothetical protein
MKHILEQKMDEKHLPVLPLPVFVLPDGKVRLRIFEKKYLKMLSLIADHQSFVIQLTSSSTTARSSYWGSLVKIQDFNQGEDGILEVDVLCMSLVNIDNTSIDKNELIFANVTPFSHWSQESTNENMTSKMLASALNNTLERNDMLSQFYQTRQLNNVHWVVARWIELLPLSVSVKNLFVQIDSFSSAKEFVDSVIFK